MENDKAPFTDKYLRALRSKAVQSALGNKQLPVNFIASCLEAGVVDCHDKTLLTELEQSLGETIRPKVAPSVDYAEVARNAPRVSSTAGMPVVGGTGGGSSFLQGSLPEQELYRQAVAETDARIAASSILQHKFLEYSILYNARKDWCSPILMRALVLDPTLVHRLRAAMYPCLVSYTEHTYHIGDKWYLTPYITVYAEPLKDSADIPRKDRFRYNKRLHCVGKDSDYDEAETVTFFLGPENSIGMMRGNIAHVYDPADFASPEAVRRYMGELKEAYCKVDFEPGMTKLYKQYWKKIEKYLGPYASGKAPIGDPGALMGQFMDFHRRECELDGCGIESTFTNIKTGERFWCVTPTRKAEWKIFGDDSHRTIDITPFIRDGKFLPSWRELLRQRVEQARAGSVESIRELGIENLRRLHEKMLSTNRCTKRGEYNLYYDLEGEEAYKSGRDFAFKHIAYLQRTHDSITIEL